MKEQKPVWDRKKAWWTRILFALLLLFLSTAHAEASEIEEEQALKEAKEAVEEALFGEFGFEEVTGALESMFPEGKMDFSKMVKEVEKGDLPTNSISNFLNILFSFSSPAGCTETTEKYISALHSVNTADSSCGNTLFSGLGSYFPAVFHKLLHRMFFIRHL